MTDVVVTDAHNTVITSSYTPRVIVTGIMGPPGTTEISKATDVDATNLTSGSLLVYNSTSEKWVATVQINQQLVDGGQY